MAIGWKTRKCTYRSNRNFVGRKGELETIHRRLRGGTARLEATSCLLLGLAGVGKTQAALEYCYRYAEAYDWQFWAPAGSHAELLGAFKSIAERIPGLARATGDAVGDVIAWLETTDESWIIIFDNIQDWASVQDIVPRRCSSPSGIMFTSQLTSIASEVDHVFSLGSLPTSEGAEVLCRHAYGASVTLAPEEREAAVQISRMFAGFPLTLAQIGRFIAESAISIQRYDKAFNSRVLVGWNGKTHATLNPRHPAGLEGETHATLLYHSPMEAVWSPALDQLSVKSMELVQVLSFMNPDQITEPMLLQSLVKDPAAWGLAAGTEELELWGMRRLLRTRSLISIQHTGGTEDAYAMQPSLQHAILLQLDRDPALRSTIFARAFNAIRLATPKANVKQIPTRKHWPQFQVAIPHIISLCRKFVQSVPSMQGTLELALLFYDGGFFLWETQDTATDDAVLLLSTSLKILDDVSYPASGHVRADILAILGMCCDRLGPAVFEQTLSMRKEARRIRQAITDYEISNDEEISATSERLLYNSLNDQGIAEMQLNRFREAKELFSVCYRKYKNWGPERDYPFEYAKYYHNMGLVRMCQGRFPEAVTFSEKAVKLQALYDRVETSPLVSLFAYHFACVLFHAGDATNALEMHLKILGEREEQHGKFGEMTLLSCYTVGAMHHHMGDLEKAEEYIRECINRAGNEEGKPWPEYARGRAYMHLARLMRARSAPEGEIEPAEKIGKAILAKYRDYAQRFTPTTDDDMVLYDALQPVLHGRFTGRGLLHLLHNLPAACTNGFQTHSTKSPPFSD